MKDNMNVIEVDYKELEDCMIKSYELRKPLFIHGGIGIGKSTIKDNVGKKLAIKLNKIYSGSHITINDETKFNLIDIRLSQYDSTDFKGVPFQSDDRTTTKWLPTEELPKTGQGIIVFEEMNLAVPTVLSSVYSIVLDRKLGKWNMPEGYSCIAIGNRLSDKSGVFELPKALSNRFLHCELITDTTKWIDDYASKNNVDSRLIAYLMFKPDKLNCSNVDRSIAFNTPRTIVYASEMIEGEHNEDKIYNYVAMACGCAFATEFSAYCKVYKDLDIDSFLKNPESVKLPLEADKQYALITALSERYAKKTDTFEPICKLALRLEVDMSIAMLKLCRNKNDKKFKSQIIDSPIKVELTKKLGKYILDTEGF